MAYVSALSYSNRAPAPKMQAYLIRCASCISVTNAEEVLAIQFSLILVLRFQRCNSQLRYWKDFSCSLCWEVRNTFWYFDFSLALYSAILVSSNLLFSNLLFFCSKFPCTKILQLLVPSSEMPKIPIFAHITYILAPPTI